MSLSTQEVNDSPHEDLLLDYLSLALIEGIGPLATSRLLDQFDSPTHVLQSTQAELESVPGIGPKLALRIITARDHQAARQQLALVQKHQLEILLPYHSTYPALLKEIHDPPLVLFNQGCLQAADATAVAIVGTRHATRYGLEQARRLAGSLARMGITVVSGMARGIDTAAHRGALEAGGRTVAVLAGGVLNPYPPENAALAREISAQGCVLSESAPTMKPLRGLFPQRNRIISGLSLGTIVIEAPLRSGSLITSRLAMEQGREVFAVPGRVDSRLSQGPHQLLRDGAKLVASIDDVLEELNPLQMAVEPQHYPMSGDQVPPNSNPSQSPRPGSPLNDIERTVLQAIDPLGSRVDQVIEATALPVNRVLSTISVLEMQHLVEHLGGNRIARKYPKS